MKKIFFLMILSAFLLGQPALYAGEHGGSEHGGSEHGGKEHAGSHGMAGEMAAGHAKKDAATLKAAAEILRESYPELADELDEIAGAEL